MPEAVRPIARQPRAMGSPDDGPRHGALGKGFTAVAVQHACSPQMPPLPKRRGWPGRQSDVASPPALWGIHLTFPGSALHTQPALSQIDISPLQGDQFA
jgi:hypothetical protein